MKMQVCAINAVPWHQPGMGALFYPKQYEPSIVLVYRACPCRRTNISSGSRSILGQHFLINTAKRTLKRYSSSVSLLRDFDDMRDLQMVKEKLRFKKTPSNFAHRKAELMKLKVSDQVVSGNHSR